ncbi:FkbM family methyltransferase, partial [Helicobacter muridarum]|uniref:FkbM family methyltransferase n=1 Tax=Helicobacter muridarum TaxID=216 RepID=UPI001F40B07B
GGGGAKPHIQQSSSTQPLVFIKMDIEGEEMNALKGMIDIITAYQPILAISVYHAPTDVYTIPKYIASLNKHYKVYFRHYSQGLIESVMFFIPQKILKS